MIRRLRYLKRPTAIAAAAGACACAWSPSALAAAPGEAPSTQPATVTLDRCHSAPLPIDRSATFTAQAAATPKSNRIWVRFTLLERLGQTPAMRPVSAPGLGVWLKSEPGIALFRYSQQVSNLPSPGSFRTSVSFRWYDLRHRLVRRARALSPVCEIS